MFDFRYHALSLAAVFLALGIGIVLGVTIGDSLVSETERSIRGSLRSAVSEANDRVDRLGNDVSERDRFIERAFPALVDRRLEGERVAVVALGSLPDDVRKPVEDAVHDAGGEIDSTSVFQTPPDVRALGDAAGRRFQRIGGDEDRLRELGRRIGRSVAQGGRLAQRLERQPGDRFRGGFSGADAIAVYHDPEEDPGKATVAFQKGLIEGLLAADAPVVGVERSKTDPSQIGFYGDNRLSSVDSVDVPAGAAALVFALGGAQGAFGFKGSADEPLPEPPAAR